METLQLLSFNPSQVGYKLEATFADLRIEAGFNPSQVGYKRRQRNQHPSSRRVSIPHR